MSVLRAPFLLVLVVSLGLVMACSDDAAPTKTDMYTGADSAMDRRIPPPDDAVEDTWVPWQPEVSPPTLAKVITEVKPDSIVAGGPPAQVTCLGYDAADQYVGVGPAEVQAAGNVKISGMSVSATVAGQAELSCVPQSSPGVEIVPATLVILPGNPVKLTLTLKPDKEIYVVTNTVTVKGIVADKYGNVTEDVPLAGVGVTPPSLGTVKNSKVTFDMEGKGEITANVDGFSSVANSIDVHVDGGAPKIEVDTPQRACELTGSSAITVEGYIKDSTGLKTATLNGKSLSTSATGFFSTTVNAKHGLNLLIIEAEDKLGNTSRHVQSFLFGEKYYPIPSGSLSQQLVPDGIAIWLDYDAFMKANGPDGTSFSYIAKEFLLALDLADLIPNPAAAQEILWCTYDIFLSNITYGEPVIELKPHPDGMTLHVKFPNLAMDLEAVASWCPDFTGKVTALALTIDAVAYVSVGSQGNLNVVLDAVKVQFVGLDIDLYGITGNLAQGVMGFFQDTLTEMIEDQFEVQIVSQFEGQIEKLLGNVTIDQWIELPPFMPGAPATEAEIHLRAAGLDSAYAGFEFFLDAAFTANDKKKQGLEGPLARSGCLTGDHVEAKVKGKHYMEVALHLDVLNQSAYTKYLEKGIDFTVDGETMAAMGTDPAEMGAEDLLVLGSAQLPPVMTDCGSGGDLRIQLGDLKLDISLTMLGMPLEMTVYLYFAAKVELEIVDWGNEQVIELTFGDVDWMDFHLSELNEEWAGNETLFAELIEETFMTQFVGMLQDYPYIVPVSQMEMDDLMPAFAGWKFVPIVDDVFHEKGQLLVNARLVVE